MSPEPASAEQNSPAPTAPEPATAPAYVLASSDGRIVASSEVFNRLIGMDEIASPVVASAINATTSGGQDLVAITVDGPRGRRLETRVEAVLGSADQRLALIEVQIPRPSSAPEAVADWFPTFAADSVAIVWLKDLQGRYTFINRQYASQLQTTPEQVCGHDDGELGQLEAIDGPRVKSGVRQGLESRGTAGEPMQLEYTIPAFDRRPAYAALRFPVRGPSGEPLAVCGVASPADHGEVALNECEHLLEVLEWFRGDARDIRHAAMASWGLTPVRPEGMEFDEPEAEANASAAELAEAQARAEAAERAGAELEERLGALQQQLASEHSRALDLEGSLTDARGRADALAASLEVAHTRAGTLDAAQARIRELESMVATASSAGVAAVETAQRLVELEGRSRALQSELERERAEREALETQGREQIEARMAHLDHQHAAELRGLEQSHAAELAELRVALAEVRAAHDHLESEAASAAVGQEAERQASDVRHRAELQAAEQRGAAELAEAAERHAQELAAAEQRHSREVAESDQRHTTELAGAESRRAAELAEAEGLRKAELEAAERRHTADRQSVAEWHQGELRAAEERRQSDLRALADRLRSESAEGDETAHRGEIELLKRLHQEELLGVREQQAFELTAAHDQEMARLREEYEHRLAAQEHHETQLSAAEDRVRTELNAANQRHQVEMSHLRDQHASQLEGSTAAAAATRAQVTALTEQLAAAGKRVEDLEAALASSRDHITRLERASAAATAAAASPIHPVVGQQPVIVNPPIVAPTASEPPASSPTHVPAAHPAAPPPILLDQPLLIGDDPRPEPSKTPEPRVPVPAASSDSRQPGWDPAAQQALTDALRGCLNLRSILSESVRLIGTGGSWDAVVAWVPNEREAKFSCAATWVRSPVEMARLETSMWQVRQSPEGSAIGAVALSNQMAWVNDPASGGDRHLAAVAAEGIHTVVLMPIKQQGQTFAVLELCSESTTFSSPQAEAALQSIEVEIGAANQRLADTQTASQWGRRRR